MNARRTRSLTVQSIKLQYEPNNVIKILNKYSEVLIWKPKSWFSQHPKPTFAGDQHTSARSKTFDDNSIVGNRPTQKVKVPPKSNSMLQAESQNLICASDLVYPDRWKYSNIVYQNYNYKCKINSELRPDQFWTDMICGWFNHNSTRLDQRDLEGSGGVGIQAKIQEVAGGQSHAQAWL
jgi:hypothetical protein